MNNGSWNAAEVVLRTVNLKKSYFRGTQVPVLRGVDLEVCQGEFVSIIGASGSGKSTLLHLLGTLDTPDSGEIFWRGKRIDNQSRSYRDHFRNSVVGFIFQFYHLLPELNTLENVLLPALIQLPMLQYLGKRGELRRRAEELLEEVGLGERKYHRPMELSGGEMQRAAIARALLSNPQIVLADEPTGNLDTDTGRGIMRLLNRLSKEHGLTVIMVTHDLELADRADRTLRLIQGQVEQCAVAA